MGVTSDPSDPRLGHGVDREPIDQHDVYLVLSEEERAKGFVRPVRHSYRHVGPPSVDMTKLRPLTDEEHERYDKFGYVFYESYDVGPDASVTGRFWTQARLDAIGGGCGAVTTMATSIAETYASDPHFYGSTYCVGCRKHLRVGADGEFVWDGTDDRVGT